MGKTPAKVMALGVALLLASTVSPAAYGIAVQDLLDPRPQAWVVDQAGVLSPEGEGELNELGRRVRTETGAELAVVVIESTGGADPKAFALELFNRWGLGDRRRNDGVLVFAALEDRAAEILLGDGLDSTQNRQLAERVMQGSMMPLFRRGEPAKALAEGARATAQQILGARLPAAEAPPGGTAALVPPVQRAAPATPRPRPAPAPSSSPTASAGDLFAGCSCLVALAAGVSVIVLLVIRLFRRKPRSCPRCKTTMVRLSEAADDRHLSPGEQAEERAGGADWEVWHCPSCNHAEKLRAKGLFSRAQLCPKCRYQTLLLSSETVERPTQWSEGLVHVREECRHCGHTTTSTQVVPRVTPEPVVVHRVVSSSSPEPERRQTAWSSADDNSRSRSRSSSSSSSSSDSSSSSGSSSSSDSGGGRSSGGGASGRW
jgi:uncharacterized protein